MKPKILSTPVWKIVVVLAGSCGASVAFTEDFEPGTSYSGPGTVVADPKDPGNQVLALAPGELTSFMTGGTQGVVSMRIYDFGEIPNSMGPRWGVAGDGQSAAATIIDRSFLPANAGYGYNEDSSKTGIWFSPKWFSGPRQVNVLDDPDTTEIFEGDGAWTTWTFEVAADGTVTIGWSRHGHTVTNASPVAVMDEVWLFGGRSGETQFGVLVDDISIELVAASPEIRVHAASGGPGAFTLEWSTEPPGTPVDVYRSSDLLEWGAPIAVSQTLGIFTDFDGADPAAYYRLVETTPPSP